MPQKSHFNISDLRGLILMLTDATLHTTDLVEDMHRRIVHPPLLPSTPIQDLVTGISGIVYRNVRGAAKLIGPGLAGMLNQFHASKDLGISFRQKESFLAVINGVLGDYLVKEDNPLATTMHFRYQGNSIPVNAKEIRGACPDLNGRILIMVHGLCMNDARWNRDGHDHGTALAKERNFTPVYLVYNSGRHISDNGQCLNQLLEQLVECWPVPVEELVMVSHSMGGLVARSAFYYADKTKTGWMKHMKKCIFLGTPHHGAPLERIGNYINQLLTFIPYVKPFSRLGKIRSCGITDLRHGNLVKEDWEDVDRFFVSKDVRTPVPLPNEVDCYALAASKGKEGENRKGKIPGDGLVQINSALGKHQDPKKTLYFSARRTKIIYQTNHSELLSSKKVYEILKSWIEE